MAKTRKMILHSQEEISLDANIPVKKRPALLRQAFARIGYEVYDVSGTYSQRKTAIKELSRHLRDGEVFDFLYSENSLRPLALPNEGSGTRFTPDLDRSLFRLANRHHIPCGVFYRDIFWKFPGFLSWRPWPVRIVSRLMYRSDLRFYARHLKALFLPSLQMADMFPPILAKRAVALPPGCIPNGVDQHSVATPLRFIYVGALGSDYEMTPILRSIAQHPDASLVLCVRPSEWEKEKHRMLDLMNESIDVVHASGEDLDNLYRSADIGLVALRPSAYRNFAISTKRYEYLGAGLPMVASAGTIDADFVAESGAGWVVEYNEDSFTSLIDQILADQNEYMRAQSAVQRVQKTHTWDARARTVAEILTK